MNQGIKLVLILCCLINSSLEANSKLKDIQFEVYKSKPENLDVKRCIDGQSDNENYLLNAECLRLKKGDKASYNYLIKLKGMSVKGALYRLGLYSEAGVGTIKDINKAIEYYEAAIKFENDDSAMVNVGVIHLENKNENKAREYFKMATELGNLNAINNITLLRFYNQEISKEEYIKSLKINFSKGNLSSGFNLALIKYKANECRSALEIFEKLQSEGHITAALAKGEIYFNGCAEIHRNPLKAHKIFKYIVENYNNSIALFYLGLLELEIGTEKLAFDFLNQAAEVGDYDAMRALGNLYWLGEWTERNPDKAIMFYINAARLGDVKALKHLKNLYKNSNEISSCLQQIDDTKIFSNMEKCEKLMFR